MSKIFGYHHLLSCNCLKHWPCSHREDGISCWHVVKPTLTHYSLSTHSINTNTHKYTLTHTHTNYTLPLEEHSENYCKNSLHSVHTRPWALALPSVVEPYLKHVNSTVGPLMGVWLATDVVIMCVYLWVPHMACATWQTPDIWDQTLTPDMATGGATGKNADPYTPKSPLICRGERQRCQVSFSSFPTLPPFLNYEHPLFTLRHITVWDVCLSWLILW